MGVPAFYRWLSQRYPKIVVDCVEEQAEMVGTVEIPVDITLSNPNGIEFNNLYLDMNGIIHPCFHPEDKPPPGTEAEVFANIFEYIDRLVAIARPRTLIYMAIDGVAPRAKMNQQRSRRFRAAQDREEQKEIEAKLRADFAKQGVHVAEKSEGETFDSNVITPGTEFMDRLAMALQWYVHKRLNSEPGWRDLTVILSDANTPGEGEHKFMQFVREQRDRPGWNPNTWHCVYGLDADLIHLALASHEPHFYILREVVFQERQRGGARGAPSGPGATMNALPESKPQVAKKPYQFLKIDVLREYLGVEFQDLRIPFEFDHERVIDDFVFMCFFVGNDFLPHMPTLDIREEGIELMLHVYREQLPRLSGYLTSGAHLHLDRVEQFIQAVGGYEDKIFQARTRKLNADKRRHNMRKAEEGARRARDAQSEAHRHSAPSELELASKRDRDIQAPDQALAMQVQDASSNAAAASQLRERLQKRQRSASVAAVQQPENGGADPTTDATVVADADAVAASEAIAETKAEVAEEAEPAGKRQKLSASAESDSAYKVELKEILKKKTDQFEEMVDGEQDVRLGEDGWKARYYEQKFGLSEPEDLAHLVADLRRCYVEGLCWVMRYYFDGVASWRWFYPYHYAPFASDLANIADLKIEFDLGEPFQPFNQLMGVFPAGSKHALPEPLRPLFDDEESPILDFYPSEFKIDMNGKRFAWQGVALLPFIEEDRLLAATGPIIAQLPGSEKRRNERRLSMILSRADAAAGRAILAQATEVKSQQVGDEKLVEHVTALPTEQTWVSGQLVPCKGDACPHTVPVPPFARSIGEPIENNRVAIAMYKDPPHQTHTCRILPGTELDPPSLTTLDAPKQGTLWCLQHEQRMNQRDRSVHPPGERRDYRYNHVGQMSMPQRPQHQQRRPPPGIMPSGPPLQQACYAGAPFVHGSAIHAQDSQLQQQQQRQQQQQFVPQGQMYQQTPQVVYTQLGGAQGGYVMQQGVQTGIAPPMMAVMVDGAAVPVMAAGMHPGQGGSFFANMRPPPAQGPNMHQAGVPRPGPAPQNWYGGGGYGSGSHRGGGGRHAPPPDTRGTQNQFQAFRDQRR